MNRQHFKVLPGAMLLLLVLGTLPGCNHKRPTGNLPMVEVYLHGPIIFKVTSDDDGKGGERAYIPRDDLRQHLMTSPDKKNQKAESSGSCEVTVDIKLVGVESFHGKPRVAAPFDAITFPASDDWKPGNGSFVTMSFPAAKEIGFLPPLYPVSFASGRNSEVPLTEVMEFPAKDIDKVRLVRTVVTRCGTAKPTKEVEHQIPLTCKEARERLNITGRGETEMRRSQRPYLAQRIDDHCSDDRRFIFVGVGLPDDTGHEQLMKHGIEFFNHKLLPEIYGSADRIPPGKVLVSINDEVLPGADPGKNKRQPPRLEPAVFRYTAGQPLLAPRPISLTENCTAPGAILR